jgi:hypothetical protein
LISAILTLASRRALKTISETLAILLEALGFLAPTNTSLFRESLTVDGLLTTWLIIVLSMRWRVVAVVMLRRLVWMRASWVVWVVVIVIRTP